MMSRAITEYFHYPESYAGFALTGPLSEVSDSFRLGPDTICYRCISAGSPSKCASENLQDVWPECCLDGSEVRLPFDPAEVAENWRLERYGSRPEGRGKATDL
jgi:hypothetical protein